MALTSTAVEPTLYGLGGSGGIPSQKNITLTYPMAASASVSRGDWVLQDTTTNVISKCTDTADNAIGVAFADIDNSSGAASDKFAPVMRQGFAFVDGLTKSSGAVAGRAINFDDVLYLQVTSAAYPFEAQGLGATNSGSLVAKSMDQVAVPADTGMTIAKIRVYLDRLSKSALLA